MQAWLKFFRIVNLPTVPGDVLVGAAAVAGGAGAAVRAEPLVAAAIASVGLYLFGLADNDLAGAKTDGAERPIPAGEISPAAARIARGLCLFATMVAGAVANLPPPWWIAAFLLAAAVVAYNRTKYPVVMGLCRGLNVVAGAFALSACVRSGRSAVALAVVAGLATLYIALVTGYARGEHADPTRRPCVALLIGSIVYLQLGALLLFYLLAPTPFQRNLLLTGAGLLILLRIAKRAFPKVSAT